MTFNPSKPVRNLVQPSLDGYPKLLHLPEHHDNIVIPDWRKIRHQQAEEVPVLNEMNQRLKVKGLHDPWMRNEIWRYRTPHMQWSFGRMLIRETFRGAGVAALLLGATVALEKIYNRTIRPAGDTRSPIYRLEEWLLHGSKGKPVHHAAHDHAHHDHHHSDS